MCICSNKFLNLSYWDLFYWCLEVLLFMYVWRVVVTLLHMKRIPKSLIPFLLHFVHCPFNVLECKHQHNLWSWRMMKNLSKKWLGKLVWVCGFFFLDFFYVSIFSLAFYYYFSLMIIGVCSAELMESLDSPPKAMTLFVYAWTIAIAQRSMSTPIPRTRTRRFSSQVNFFFHARGNRGP